MTDTLTITETEAALLALNGEMSHGRGKHGTMPTLHDGMARLGYEVDELRAECAKHGKDEYSDRLVKLEALQVAAVAMRIYMGEWGG